jgi:hypothetical protein
MILDGVTETTADAWIDAREAQAVRDGLSRDAAYWQAGWTWIAEERERRAKP